MTETQKIARRLRVCEQLADNYTRLVSNTTIPERRTYYQSLVTQYNTLITQLTGN